MFPTVNIQHLAADMPQQPQDHPEFWKIWREAIRRIEPRAIDHVFASEHYGQRLADELGAAFMPVDIQREMRPFSATGVRNDPMAAWDAIPECVRPHYVRRVCVVGPESTGKSTLCRILAAEFKTVYAWEHARAMLDPKGGVCDESDIEHIARAQPALEDAMARQANRVLFCDTSPMLTVLWSKTLFGRHSEWIVEVANARRYDLTLLLDVDVPWVDDNQRYFPDSKDRKLFFDQCREMLDKRGDRYIIIRGSYEQRTEMAIKAVRELLADSVV